MGGHGKAASRSCECEYHHKVKRKRGRSTMLCAYNPRLASESAILGCMSAASTVLPSPSLFNTTEADVGTKE